MSRYLPFGYEVKKGKITITNKTCKLVQEIFQLYDNDMSMVQITKLLMSRNEKNANGRVNWSHRTVGSILSDKRYLGTQYYAPIIDREVFERVQQKREKNRIKHKKGRDRARTEERMLFDGIIKCKKCGALYRRYLPTKGSKKHNLAQWRCEKNTYWKQYSCKSAVVTDEDIKEVCVDAINQLIGDQRIMKAHQENTDRVSKEYRILENQIKREIESEGFNSRFIDLIFRKAEARYQTLEVNDRDFRTQEMRIIIAEITKQEEFDGDLYRKLINEISLCDNTACVEFINGSSIEIAYKNN